VAVVATVDQVVLDLAVWDMLSQLRAQQYVQVPRDVMVELVQVEQPVLAVVVAVLVQ
jgi:hypothetical protein